MIHLMEWLYIEVTVDFCIITLFCPYSNWWKLYNESIPFWKFESTIF